MSATITYTELRQSLYNHLVNFGSFNDIDLWELVDHILEFDELDRKVQGYSPDQYEFPEET